jgi:putative transcriptional regulator
MYIACMIRLKLNEMLELRGLTAYGLHVKSKKKLHQSVISKIKHNDSKALQLETLDLLCDLLDCQPADLIVYESTTQTALTTQDVERATQSTKHTQNASDNVMSFQDTLVELEQIGKSKSDSSLRRYLKTGKLKGELVGGNLWEIKKSDFENFIHSNFFKSLK